MPCSSRIRAGSEVAGIAPTKLFTCGSIGTGLCRTAIGGGGGSIGAGFAGRRRTGRFRQRLGVQRELARARVRVVVLLERAATEAAAKAPGTGATSRPAAAPAPSRSLADLSSHLWPQRHLLLLPFAPLSSRSHYLPFRRPPREPSLSNLAATEAVRARRGGAACTKSAPFRPET